MQEFLTIGGNSFCEKDIKQLMTVCAKYEINLSDVTLILSKMGPTLRAICNRSRKDAQPAEAR